MNVPTKLQTLEHERLATLLSEVSQLQVAIADVFLEGYEKFSYKHGKTHRARLEEAVSTVFAAVGWLEHHQDLNQDVIFKQIEQKCLKYKKARSTISTPTTDARPMLHLVQ